jgi:hypothetical protein
MSWSVQLQMNSSDGNTENHNNDEVLQTTVYQTDHEKDLW